MSVLNFIWMLSILNMEWNFTHFDATIAFYKCDQLFFAGCTFSFYRQLCFVPNRILFTKIFCHFQFATHQILFIFHFRSTRRNEIFIYIHQKKKNATFFFWWFKMKCNQTVKYSNKRGILDKSCHLRYINSVYDQSEFSCLAFSAIIVMSFSSFVAHKK